MDFKTATDKLFERVDHEDLAKALGVSVASIRQARLHESAKAKRSAPAQWKSALLTLAAERANHYQALVQELGAL